MKLPYCPLFVVAASAFSLLGASATAPAADEAPPVDRGKILQALKGIKEQRSQQGKALRARGLQQAMGAAADPAKALEAWEDAVRLTQFNGAAREATQFREWKEHDGDALKERECQSALHLYFTWLSVTLRRSDNAPLKTLLPALLTYTRELEGDQALMESSAETARHEKELEETRKHGQGRPRSNDEGVKKMHDQILGQSLVNSIVVQALKLGPLLEAADQSKNHTPPGPGWEMSPGNYDGIYQTIILPEQRAEKDPRIVEYWDRKLKKEAEAANRSKLSFEAEKFNQVRMPQLLWSRAQDLTAIGEQNRGLSDMFKLVQGYPGHPDAQGWITALERALAPPAPAAPSGPPAAPATSAAPAPAPESAPAELPPLPEAAESSPPGRAANP